MRNAQQPQQRKRVHNHPTCRTENGKPSQIATNILHKTHPLIRKFKGRRINILRRYVRNKWTSFAVAATGETKTDGLSHFPINRPLNSEYAELFDILILIKK